MNKPLDVWLVDDDASIRWVLEKALRQSGMQTRAFEQADSVLTALGRGQPDVLITDVRMPGTSGLKLLETVREEHPRLPVIVMTAHSDLDTAVASYQGGAFEYLPKPFDIDQAVELVKRAAAQASLAGGAEPLVGHIPEILGQAPAMQEVFRAIGRLSRSSMTVLITGESGTGKELVARALHRHSPRAAEPFIALNTSAFTAELLESELFGHERGAFTGAVSSRRGKFEMAHGGTLFLDEVAEMPLELQGKLLRAIQDGELERVGSDRPVKVDVRIIAATNRKLRAEVDNGRFREDLYYRLNVYPITVPPLRTRRDDIPMLAAAIVRRLAADMAKSVDKIPQAVIDELTSYDWPGNVRELENVLEQAVIAATGQTLRLTTRLRSSPSPREDPPDGPRLPLVEVERRHILSVLGDVEWRIAGAGGAAALLDLNPSTLRSRMVKLGIKKPGES